MIEERRGDLLEQKDLTHIAHQANLYHTFGAGLAFQIAQKYPWAVDVDRETVWGDSGRLGTYSIGTSKTGYGPNVVNLYTQVGFGPGSTDYDYMRMALRDLEDTCRLAGNVRLGIPYHLGCGLAGGSWPKVYGILEDVFGKSPVEVVIVRRPEDF